MISSGIQFPRGVQEGAIHFMTTEGVFYRYLGGGLSSQARASWVPFGGAHATDPDTTGWGAAQDGGTWFNKALDVLRMWDGSKIVAVGRVVQNKHTAINRTTGVLGIGEICGSRFVVLESQNATPGNQQICTALQLVEGSPGVIAGDTYRLRIVQSGNGTLTLTTNTGVTLTGTMTVPWNTFRDFIVTFDSLTAVTIRSIATGAFS